MVADVGFLGRARAGKDTAANMLTEMYGHRKVAFADPIRDMLLRIDPWVVPGVRLSTVVAGAGGWDDAKDIAEVRRLMQELGVSGREILADSVWLTIALGRMWSRPGSPIVVPDVRFRNEANALRDHGFTLIRLTRPDAPAVRPHITEYGLDDYAADYTFTNGGRLDALRAFLRETVVPDLALAA